MSVFFLFLAFGLLFLLFETTGEVKEWRRSILLSSIVWSLFLVAATEGLSFFGALSKGPLVSLWVILNIGLIALLAPRWNTIKGSLRPPPLSFGGVEWFMVVGGALLLAVTLTVALWAPPNSWDAMTYHMPRVMHWIQNQTVAFYPTHIIRQIYMPPFAEYVILNFQLATGGDRLANLPQFFSMVGAAIAVSLIARILGANRQGQILAAIFALTIPSGILESTGAKNDFVLSFWMVTFAFFGLEWKEKPSDGARAMTAGLSLGLALLTKGTAYVLALPFIVWFGIAGVIALGVKVWRPILIVAVFSIALNAPQYLRNMEVFGHPLGTMAEEYEHLKPTNDIYTPAAFMSNLVRNASLHLGTSSNVSNATLFDAIKWLHDNVLGIGISEPATTWDIDFYVQGQNILYQHENFTSNPVHFLLISLAFLFSLPAVHQRALPRPAVGYAMAAVGALCLLLLIFKWTPSNIRYHLPIFLLLAPCFGLLISKIESRSFLTAIIAFALLAQTAPAALMNRSRPLMPITKPLWNIISSFTPASRVNSYNRLALVNAKREALLFADHFVLYKPYLSTIAFLKSTGCREIGFISDLDNDPSGQWAMEYQFWALLEGAFPEGYRFRHVNVINNSKVVTPIDPFSPCALLKTYEQSESWSGKSHVAISADPINVKGIDYHQSFFDTVAGVYIPGGVSGHLDSE